MAEGEERDPNNCPGPFYVARDECMSCGAPETVAGGLMSHDEGGHCFFVRQPESEAEVAGAIAAMGASCCGAVRYGGDDPKILVQLVAEGYNDQCDAPLPRPGSFTPLRGFIRYLAKVFRRGDG